VSGGSGVISPLTHVCGVCTANHAVATCRLEAYIKDFALVTKEVGLTLLENCLNPNEPIMFSAAGLHFSVVAAPVID
jgi:hypothetical protein